MVKFRISALQSRLSIVASLAVATALVAAVLMAYTTATASEDTQKNAKKVRLVLPAGTYTSVVFTAYGSPGAQAAIGELKVGTDKFMINVGPGVTIAIPFGAGWELKKDAIVELSHTPDPPFAVPSAWAVTPTGPVALRPR